MTRRKRGSARTTTHNSIGQKRKGDHSGSDTCAAEDEFYTLPFSPSHEDEEEAGDDAHERQQNIIGSYNHLLSHRLKRLRRQNASTGRSSRISR